jgi:uncharacterized protein (TIGR00269 family)
MPVSRIEQIDKLTTKRMMKVLKAIKGKKIIVATSGGKDSMFLVHRLLELRVPFAMLHLYLGYGAFSDEQRRVVEKFAEEHEIQLHVEDLSHLRIPEVAARKGRKVCSVCGVAKRYYFNKLARELGYDVLVTAHNLSDIYKFLLINLSTGTLEYSARNLPVKYPAHPKQVIFAKPLYYVPESWIRLLVDYYGIEHAKLKCPYVEHDFWKEIVAKIEERDPNILYTSVKFFVKKYAKLIPVHEERLRSCKICGEPTASKDGICTFCKLFRNA